MILVDLAEKHLLSRGLPISYRDGIEIRASVEEAAVVGRAIELLEEFGRPHRSRAARSIKSIVRSVRPTSYTRFDIGLIYVCFDSDAPVVELVIGIIILNCSSTFRAESLLRRYSPAPYSEETWKRIGGIGVDRCTRFLDWYMHRHGLPEAEHRHLAEWIGVFIESSTRSGRRRILRRELTDELRRLWRNRLGLSKNRRP